MNKFKENVNASAINYVHSFILQLKKGGGTTEDVVVLTAYLTVRSHNVTLMGRTRVAVMSLEDIVVTQTRIVVVSAAQTTGLYTRSGENHRVNKSGGPIKSVAS